jgi:hypothetical protein
LQKDPSIFFTQQVDKISTTNINRAWNVLKLEKEKETNGIKASQFNQRKKLYWKNIQFQQQYRISNA